jgi:hypothetical protein
MKTPGFTAEMSLNISESNYAGAADNGNISIGVIPQRCDRWKKLRCAGKIAVCAAGCSAASGPAWLVCMLSCVPRECGDCVK